MARARATTITDAQLGRAFRRVIRESRGWDIVVLADTDTKPYALVLLDAEEAHTSETAVATAPNLDVIIDTLLQEELETGRELAIDELFDDPEHGFNLDGLSLGTLAAAMQLAPGVPIPRDLLYAVSAEAATEVRDTWDTAADIDDADDWDEEDPAEDSTTASPSESLHKHFTRPALLLARTVVDHLIAGGTLVEDPDGALLLHADLYGRDLSPLQIGQVRAEQALLSIVPHLFDTQNTSRLRLFGAHLRHVTDRGLPRATLPVMALAFLTADYYTTIDLDHQQLRHYLTQGCAILDLMSAQITPSTVSWLANDLYGIAKVAHDAGMIDVAAIAYARSFELSARPDAHDDDDLAALLGESPHTTVAMQGVIAELGVQTALECGDTAIAQRVVAQLRACAAADGSAITQHQADYLAACITLNQGETAVARQQLTAIIAWSHDHADDLDDLVMIVDFLLVAWITLAKLELREGAISQAAALLQRAAALLDNDDLQAIYPDNPKNPNDTRQRLRTRMLEAQALVAWASAVEQPGAQPWSVRAVEWCAEPGRRAALVCFYH